MEVPIRELPERDHAAREIHICMYHMTIEDLRLVMQLAKRLKSERLEDDK